MLKSSAVRRRCFIILIIITSSCLASNLFQLRMFAQETKTFTYDVASVRAHKPGYRPTFGKASFTPDTFIGTNVLVQQLIVMAYDLRDPLLTLRSNLIPGGPQWIQSDWYDIQAKMSDESVAEMAKLTPEQRDARQRLMLQSLLAQRFKLEVGHEIKQSSAYQLIVAKSSSKDLREDTDDGAQSITWSDGEDGRKGEYRRAPISLLIRLLENLLRVPVLDKTGLTGKYDFTLEWMRDPSTMPPPPPGYAPPDSSSGLTIFSALQQELGLKLVPVKIPISGLVIEHIERPSEN